MPKSIRGKCPDLLAHLHGKLNTLGWRQVPEDSPLGIDRDS
jgi:hypothetical protein